LKGSTLTPGTLLWPVGAVFLCSEAGGYLMPLVLEAVTRTYSISEAAAGPVMAMQLAAYAIAAVGLSPWLGKLSPRRGAAFALGLIVAGNLLSASQPLLATLLTGRVLAGLGEGSAAAVATAMLARTADPDRAFARMFTAVVLMTLVIFLGLPTLMAGRDARVLFVGMSAVPLLAIPAIAFLSDRVVLPKNRTVAPGQAMSLPAAVVCAALSLYAIAANAYWVYLERIATSIGMTPATYGKAFAAGSVCALAGPLAAQWLGTRFGRILPLCIGCGLVGGGGWLATHGTTPAVFVLGITTSSAALMFGAPYFLGLASELDPAGRVAAAARGFNAAGAALAPAIAGGILGVTGTYRSIGWTSLVAAVAALGLVLFVAARKPRDSTRP
jgi:MFS family permease